MISSLLLAALIKLPPVECKRADFHGFILWITADHLQASKHKTTWLSGKKETGANGKPLRNGREETFTPLFGDYGVLLHFFTESNNVEYLHSNQLKAVSSVFPVLWLQVFHSGKKKYQQKSMKSTMWLAWVSDLSAIRDCSITCWCCSSWCHGLADLHRYCALTLNDLWRL